MHRACRHSCRVCGGGGGGRLRRFNTSSFDVGLEPRGTIGLLRPHAIGGDFSYTMPPLKGGKASGQHRLGDLTIRLARPSAPSATGSGQADGCKGASDSLVLPPNCRQDTSRHVHHTLSRRLPTRTAAAARDGHVCDPSMTPSGASDSDGRCGGWAEVGECVENQGYMLRMCRRSCLCAEGGGRAPQLIGCTSVGVGPGAGPLAL